MRIFEISFLDAKGEIHRTLVNAKTLRDAENYFDVTFDYLKPERVGASEVKPREVTETLPQKRMDERMNLRVVKILEDARGSRN